MINKNTIPQHWEVKKLGEIVKTTSGGTPSRKEAKFYNGDIPWVKSGELNRGVIFDTEEKITQEAIKNSSAKIFPKGTLLIALYGATIGKLAFLGIEAATNQAVCGIYENDKVALKYLYYYLYFSKPDLLKQSIGGAQPNISQTILKELNVTLPPLSEQQEIVAKIEELFSELDKGKEQLETARQQLKVYRQAVLRWAFEGKFTNAEVNDGELPEGWKWVTMADVCNKIGDIDHKMPKNLPSGIPYVSTKDFTNDFKISFDKAKYISDEDYQNLSRKIKPEKGDIIFPRYGTIGKNILIDYDKKFLVSYSCAIVKPNPKLVLSKYLYLYTLSPKITKEIRKYIVETTQANIGIASIKKFVFPLCSIDQQSKVIQDLESRLSVCDKMEETISHSLQQAETLRQSILKQAFEGKLVTIGIAKTTIEQIQNESSKVGQFQISFEK
ncbi:restriction endonuclease subunit S [Pontibacter virosus]|uniref:Type I restriction enzyme S subunit n=1 Tax=Pontibacter virosus TaxID=1765052 RepID=A0A2U1B0Z1_9BACT|nr:restriction endonuclease subunit S [Pontibacter virosus]PVY42338.1 type I restriction enzyme S subunit [Pontibacter virosus]